MSDERERGARVRGSLIRSEVRGSLIRPRLRACRLAY